MLWSRCGDVPVHNIPLTALSHNAIKHLSSVYSDYGNFKWTNQVERNEGSIFHSHLVSGIYSWPLAPSTGMYWHAYC